MAVTVGLRELRHNTRAVIERSIAEGVIQISDRDTVIGYLLSPDAYRASGAGAPRLTALAALIENRQPTDTGAWDELMASKDLDRLLERTLQ